MYFLYVDESGDCGKFNHETPQKSGTKYFILSGLLVHDSKWKIALDTLKAFRKKIAREGFLAYDVEFHCAEMIDPHKTRAYTSISVKDRWVLIEEFAEVIGQQKAFQNITVVIDKTSTQLLPSQYLTAAIDAMYLAFDEFLKSKQENGLVFLDRANEKLINTHVRTILGTGVSQAAPAIRIGWIIEDPIFKNSSDSFFVQASDLCAYTAKEFCFPLTARKKFQADRIFSRKIGSSIFKSLKANKNGIIEL
jgi:hypothetical protein